MPNLLSPFVLKSISLRNRIVLPPMANNQSTDQGEIIPAMHEHYAERAMAGVALVITEHSFVHPSGRANPRQVAIDRDERIPGLRALAHTIKAAGAAAAIQITHAGSNTTPATLGRTPLGASAVPHPKQPGGVIPQALAVEEIQEIVQAFAAAAVRAQQAGFDAVEIHGAHGYLLNQFYSPLTNRREDDWGGSPENRLRLPLAVTRAVRSAVGPTYPVFYRLGADDLIPGGLTVADALYAAPHLVEAGVDLLDITGGLGGYRPEGAGPGYFVSHAVAIKAVTPVPLLVTGGITAPDLADRLVREGKTDLVGIGRALLADPLWAKKAADVLSQ